MENIEHLLDFLKQINDGIIERNGDEETRKLRVALIRLTDYLNKVEYGIIEIDGFNILFKECKLELAKLSDNGYIPLNPNQRKVFFIILNSYEEQIKRELENTKVYEISANKKLILIKGDIAEHKGDAIFFLNLSSTWFPASGPVVGAIYDKDLEIKKSKKMVSILKAMQKYAPFIKKLKRTISIWEAIQAYVPKIKDAKIKKGYDKWDAIKYIAAEFNKPRPYEVYSIDIRKARWPNLKHLIFGNVGNENEGVLFHRWKPIESQQPILYGEIDLLIKRALQEAYILHIQNLAMPILTGNRASSIFFYRQLSSTLLSIEKSIFPDFLTIFAYSKEDYKKGYMIFDKIFKH